MTDNIDLDSLPGNMTDQQIAELITTNPQAAFEAGWIAGESAARAALASPTSSAVEPVATNYYATAFYKIAEVMGIGAQNATPERIFNDQMLPKLRAAFTAPPAQAAPVSFGNCINESENFPCRDWCRLPECRSDSATPTQPAAQPAGVVCGWSEQDEDDGTWATGCGNLFTFVDGGPNENDFRHCCYCGGSLTVKP